MDVSNKVLDISAQELTHVKKTADHANVKVWVAFDLDWFTAGPENRIL